jgi:hypothetical protein
MLNRDYVKEMWPEVREDLRVLKDEFVDTFKLSDLAIIVLNALLECAKEFGELDACAKDHNLTSDEMISEYLKIPAEPQNPKWPEYEETETRRGVPLSQWETDYKKVEVKA